jgi:predicted porin
LQWQLRPGVRIGGGYTFYYTYPAGSESGTLHTPEHRLFQQLQLSHSAGDVSFSHRYRFENRWSALHDSARRDDHVTGWRTRQRFRYQVKTTLPLGSGRTYLTAFDEVFINMGAGVRYNVFDQNRFAAGLGMRITPRLRLETYYQNHLVLHADGRGVDRNHVWMTVLNSTYALRRSTRQ